MKLLSFIFATLRFPLAAANAALVTVDSPLGPEAIARDTVQGLDWLNLRLTANMSIGEVLAETVQGGRLEGFRYTDFMELRTLYRPFLACTYVNNVCDNYGPMRFFIDAIGGNPEGFAAPYHLGMTENFEVVPRVYIDTAFFEFFPEPIPHYGYDAQQLAVPYTRRSESGYFLVRATRELPEPGISFLVGIGALVLNFMHKRTQSMRGT